MSEIEAVISDLDGTLVDTFEANFQAYRTVLADRGIALDRETYRRHFGLRITEFLAALEIPLSAEDIAAIRRAKAERYPEFFSELRPNRILLEFLRRFRAQGGKTALATTASRTNVERVLRHIGAEDLFDVVVAGEDVRHGKPDPECYLAACEKLRVSGDRALVFEDTELGIEAARRAGIASIRIGEAFYGA